MIFGAYMIIPLSEVGLTMCMESSKGDIKMLYSMKSMSPNDLENIVHPNTIKQNTIHSNIIH